MIDFSGRFGIVTGGASGIGAADLASYVTGALVIADGGRTI